MTGDGQNLTGTYHNNELAVARREGNIRSYGVIKGIMGSRVVDTLPLRVRCECGVSLCEEIIEVSLAKRRELRRSYPKGFIVVIAHVNLHEDSSLHDTDRFSVVVKPGFTYAVTDL